MNSRVVLLAPMAAVGLLSAHQVTYERFAAEAPPGHASMLLAAQSWLPGLPALLITLSVAAFLTVAASRRGRVALPHPLAVLATQFGLFLLMETTDRVLHGCCPLPETHLLLLALAAQLPAALLVWVVTRFVLIPFLQHAVTRTLTLRVVPAALPAPIFDVTAAAAGVELLLLPLRRGPPRLSFGV